MKAFLAALAAIVVITVGANQVLISTADRTAAEAGSLPGSVRLD